MPTEWKNSCVEQTFNLNNSKVQTATSAVRDMAGSQPARTGNFETVRMAQLSIVEIRKFCVGTFARAKRASSAALPAFVCVRTSTGFEASRAPRESAISWVLPHPAGAVTVPLGAENKSISGIVRPPEQFHEPVLELRIAVR